MSKIDSQMQKIYDSCTRSTSDGGTKVTQEEALRLIRRADELNTGTSSSFSPERRKGNKYLSRLMEKGGFSPEAKQMINTYKETGRIPSQGRPGTHGPGHGGHGGGVTGGGHGHGGHGGGVTGGGHGHGGHGGGVTGGGGGSVPTHPGDRPTGGSGGSGNSGGVTGPGTPPVVGGDTGVEGPNGKVILDWSASKRTWACHWFPMQETNSSGGDPVNNLYAEGGPLQKLDMLNGGSARAYEYANNRKGYGEGKQYSWWGHCNNASEAACILPEPKHSVIMTGRDGSQVKFTRTDIQGLLVKVTPSLITRVDFKGDRFNEAGRDNPNDPRPDVFLQVMQDWAKEGIPFVLDIDSKEQVWNYPYDSCKISESDKAPAGFGGSPGAGTKFYHIEMAGTGFDEKKRVYECYVQRDASGNVLDAQWIKTPNTHNNPDFMWRPHPKGDVMDKSMWRLSGRPSNPEVDAQLVYEIYMKSLA